MTKLTPKTKNRIEKTTLFIVMLALAFIALAPYYWSILISFRPQSEIYATRSWLPVSVTLEHYKNVFENVAVVRYFFNTIGLTAVNIFTNLLFASMAAYGFEKLRFRGGKLIFRIMMLSMMLPGIATTVPTFLLLRSFPLVGGNDIFGNSRPLLALNRDDYIIMPRTATLDDTDSTISYETNNDDQAAVITYKYHGIDIGTVRVDFVQESGDTHVFGTQPEGDSTQETPEEAHSGKSVVFINIVRVLTALAGIAAVFIILCLIRAVLKNYQISFRRIRRNWRRNNKKKPKRPNRFRDYDF